MGANEKLTIAANKMELSVTLLKEHSDPDDVRNEEAILRSRTTQAGIACLGAVFALLEFLAKDDPDLVKKVSIISLFRSSCYPYQVSC